MKTDTDVDVCNETGVFKNDQGEIKVGTHVSFMVENQETWAGDLCGELVYLNGHFKVKTGRSGILTINRGFDVYFNTIRPV